MTESGNANTFIPEVQWDVSKSRRRSNMARSISQSYPPPSSLPTLHSYLPPSKVPKSLLERTGMSRTVQIRTKKSLVDRPGDSRTVQLKRKLPKRAM